jgi:hypothetical protein
MELRWTISNWWPYATSLTCGVVKTFCHDVWQCKAEHVGRITFWQVFVLISPSPLTEPVTSHRTTQSVFMHTIANKQSSGFKSTHSPVTRHSIAEIENPRSSRMCASGFFAPIPKILQQHLRSISADGTADWNSTVDLDTQDCFSMWTRWEAQHYLRSSCTPYETCPCMKILTSAIGDQQR